MRAIWDELADQLEVKINVLYDYRTGTYTAYYVSENKFRWQNSKGKDVWGVVGTGVTVTEALDNYIDNLQGLSYVYEDVKIAVPINE